MKVDETLFILVILYYKPLHMVLRSGGSDETVKGQDESQDCLKPSHVRDPIEIYYSEIPLLRPPKIRTFYLLKTLF